MIRTIPQYKHAFVRPNSGAKFSFTAASKIQMILHFPPFPLLLVRNLPSLKSNIVVHGRVCGVCSCMTVRANSAIRQALFK